MLSESLTKFNYTVDSLAHLNATEFLIFKKTGFLNISHGIFGNLLPEYVLHGGGGGEGILTPRLYQITGILLLCLYVP